MFTDEKEWVQSLRKHKSELENMSLRNMNIKRITYIDKIYKIRHVII